MDANAFRTLFLLFFAAEVGVNWWLNRLNRKEIEKHPQVPDFFRDRVTQEAYAKSQAYAKDRLGFDQLSLVASTLFMLLLLFSGVLPWYDSLLGQSDLGRLTHGVVFLAGLMLVQSLFRIPFSIYETFAIESRYGFNTMTWKLWVTDMVKGLLLAALLGIPFLYAILWFLYHSGPFWWLWTLGFITGFQILILLLYPRFIAPLFNKFKPLEDGELKESLLALADRLRFPTRDLYVMDGSRRSTHSNAFFTGFGKMRRIVLYDTLIAQMDTEELKHVLTHEIGHYKLNHIYRMLGTQILLTAVVLWLLSLAIDWPPLYQAFGFDSPSWHAGLFLFMAVFGAFAFLLAPLRNRTSRKHEYQADAYAVEHAGRKEAMESALMKLSEKNLSNLTPHKWYSAFHYSHPSLFERVSALRKL